MAEVLPVHRPDDQSYFSRAPLRRSRSSPSHSPFLISSPPYTPSPSCIHLPIGTDQCDISFQFLRSEVERHSRLAMQSECGGDRDDDDDDDDDETEDTASSSYGICSRQDDETDSKADTCRLPSSGSDSVISTNTSSTPEPLLISEDDSAIKHVPTRHVDYLTHDWREEDIWSSWRHITSNRKTFGQRSRLENASWRTWAKAKYQLQTISPTTLNWFKDCDVTWLYGPLQTASYTPLTHPVSETESNTISKNDSFISRKPILKKRTMSEAMLQRSLSNSSLIKQAAAAVQAERSSATTLRPRPRPPCVQTISDYAATPSIPSKGTSREAMSVASRSTSGLHSPLDGEKKHIRFDDKVEQCIAVECKYAEEYLGDEVWAARDDYDSSDDALEIHTTPKRLSRTASKINNGVENRTIQKLPDTTLKYRLDSPDVPDRPPAHSLGFWRSNRLVPSPSQETLRPSRSTSNFLLGEDDDYDEDEDEEYSWEPTATFSSQRTGLPSQRPDPDEDCRSNGLRRTPSGMFMPFDDDDDVAVVGGLLGKVLDTVNTARDIAHVIWNVGWRN